ncbi:11441_t:CDS:2 [Paraglomus brasilianum]|uniref:11441_t:CDS:1 n=1 Tax=Paraglomus brasilianum TaxID=144538 RepID=A0A9N9D891_9GLOM|nr:11441_t:CDS:2 [Paraglomus brasilianum]
MNDKYPEQSEVEWTLLSLLNNKQTNQCQQPEKIIEASSTSMEPISILEHMKIWEESFLFSQPPNINTNSNTADTIISSKEKTTEESNAYYTKDKVDDWKTRHFEEWIGRSISANMEYYATRPDLPRHELIPFIPFLDADNFRHGEFARWIMGLEFVTLVRTNPAYRNTINTDSYLLEASPCEPRVRREVAAIIQGKSPIINYECLTIPTGSGNIEDVRRMVEGSGEDPIESLIAVDPAS